MGDRGGEFIDQCGKQINNMHMNAALLDVKSIIKTIWMWQNGVCLTVISALYVPLIGAILQSQ